MKHHGVEGDGIAVGQHKNTKQRVDDPKMMVTWTFCRKSM
jgi:hypothetical protein